MAPSSPTSLSIGRVAQAELRLEILLPAEARGMARAYVGVIGEQFGSWRYSMGDRTGRDWAARGGYFSDRSCRRGTAPLEALGLVDRGLRAWQTRTPALRPERWIELGAMVDRGDVPALEAQLALAETEARAAGRLTAGLSRALSQIRDRLGRWARGLADQAARVVARGRPSQVQPEGERRPGDSGGPLVDEGPPVPAWVAGLCAEAGLRLAHRTAWATLQAAIGALQPEATDDQVAELAPGLARLLRSRAGRPAQLVEEAQALTRAVALDQPPRPLRRLRARLVEGRGALSLLRGADWLADSTIAARALQGRSPAELAQLDAAYRRLLDGEAVTPAPARGPAVTRPAGRPSAAATDQAVDRAQRVRDAWAALPEGERSLRLVEARAGLGDLVRWNVTPAELDQLAEAAAIGALAETL